MFCMFWADRQKIIVEHIFIYYVSYTTKLIVNLYRLHEQSNM